MKERFYHYSYTGEDSEGTFNGVVCVNGTDEHKVSQFVADDISDTYPDGVVLTLNLTDVTDENGRRL